jgi:hypothetical protein
MGRLKGRRADVVFCRPGKRVQSIVRYNFQSSEHVIAILCRIILYIIPPISVEGIFLS